MADFSGSPHLSEPTKIRCPRCASRLDIVETPSGGRTVSVAYLGVTVEANAAALELFFGPDSGIEIRCPACNAQFDPSTHIPTINPLQRPQR